MTIDEIVKYVFSSPENTNPNVLRSILSNLQNISTPIDDITIKVEIHNTDTQKVLNKTWQELYDAFTAGKLLYAEENGDKIYLLNFYGDEEYSEYTLSMVYDYDRVYEYITNSPSDYPVQNMIF